MPPSNGQIAFSYGVTEVLLPVPDAGYSTEIRLPFDLTKLDDKTYNVRDEGPQYDKRSCRVELFLSPTEQGELNTLLNSTGRGQSLILTLPSNSGFFPFGPDKGDTGAFTVVVTFDGTPAIQMAPYRYFRCILHIVNVGAWPVYVLPTEVAEGDFTIATITECRMPSNLFEPAQEYAIDVSLTENSTAHYIDRGSGGDAVSSRFTMKCNESKCAIILYNLLSIIRTDSFTIITGDYYYTFGADHYSSHTYIVQLIGNSLTIKHNGYNDFEISTELLRIRDDVVPSGIIEVENGITEYWSGIMRI